MGFPPLSSNSPIEIDLRRICHYFSNHNQTLQSSNYCRLKKNNSDFIYHVPFTFWNDSAIYAANFLQPSSTVSACFLVCTPHYFLRKGELFQNVNIENVVHQYSLM